MSITIIFFGMSSYFNIGVQRSRKGQKRSGAEMIAQYSAKNTAANNNKENITQQTMPQQQPPQQPPQQFTPNQQFAPQQQIPVQNQQQYYQSPTTQQLIERLSYLESRNQELKSELSFHNKKLEVLEKQMMVFFQKLDKYEQAQSPSSNGQYVPTQPAMIEVQNDPSGTNKWQFQSV